MIFITFITKHNQLIKKCLCFRHVFNFDSVKNDKIGKQKKIIQICGVSGVIGEDVKWSVLECMKL